jgi:DNA-binding PadR family transcriptional regulator
LAAPRIGIARRIEQASGDLRSINYGTLYPALLKLELEGYIASERGASDNNRTAPDGKRFLVRSIWERGAEPPLVLVTNWQAGLTK